MVESSAYPGARLTKRSGTLSKKWNKSKANWPSMLPISVTPGAACQHGVYTKTPAGHFFLHVIASLAQMERELIMEHTQEQPVRDFRLRGVKDAWDVENAG